MIHMLLTRTLNNLLILNTFYNSFESTSKVDCFIKWVIKHLRSLLYYKSRKKIWDFNVSITWIVYITIKLVTNIKRI